jgi:hypothetical protein
VERQPALAGSVACLERLSHRIAELIELHRCPQCMPTRRLR